MMVYCQAEVLWALAFDNEGNADPSRNESSFEDLGWFPNEIAENFGKERYAKAISYKILAYEQPPQTIWDRINPE